MLSPRGSVIALSCLLLLGGCVSFGAKPPAELLTVASTSRIEPGAVLRASGGALTVLEPDVAKAIDNLRVAVLTREDTYAYVPDASWVDTPQNLFRAVLAETVAARNGTLVLDPGQYAAGSQRRLTGELIAFGIDAGAMQGVVTFDAALVGNGRDVLVKRRFTATAPLSKIEPGTVAPAIQAAANDVAVQVADWLKTAE